MLLPEDLYRALRKASQQTKQPATVLAREAIEAWLERRERDERRQAITDYARTVGGTRDDLDDALEAATLESWHDLP